jgi:hypothetical protein
MRKRLLYALAFCAVAALAAAVLSGQSPRARDFAEATPVDRPPHIHPDYAGCMIPPNIAPLNFLVEEPGARYHVRISSKRGEGVEISSGASSIVIPQEPWKKLLAENRGEELRFDVCVMPQGGQWRRFEAISNTIAREEIDGYLVYRLIYPLYNSYLDMSIRQRNLQDYDESVLLDNDDFRGTHCMNCHTFLNNKGDSMILQVRGPTGGMLIEREGRLTKVDPRTKLNPSQVGFASWHPSGRVIAYSSNNVRQLFHSARTEVRDGVDLNSYLALFWVDTNTVTSSSKIALPDQLETWPTWTPDGRCLYFCRAPRLWPIPPKNALSQNNVNVDYDLVRTVKYDLMRIGFDIETGTWGEVETVLSSKDTGLSITEPRISPDGRFLVFCMSDYSTYPTWQPSSDLYLMDLKSGRYGRMECNSDQAETWHCWSSNSRWLVFSSKRGNGLLNRAYFSYIDDHGKAHKPFVLPQKDPAFYDSCIHLYQLPELISGPVPVSEQQFARAVSSPGAVKSESAAASATLPVIPDAPSSPWTPAEQQSQISH